MRPTRSALLAPLATLCACVHGAHVAPPLTVAVDDALLALPDPLRPLDARVMAAALDGHGAWRELPRFGLVWTPTDPQWTPFVTRGRWVPSAQGPFWQGDDPWSVVTAHYGRWTVIDGRAAWLPGARFSPAWVQWRADGEWIGWAPRAPDGDAAQTPFVYVHRAELTANVAPVAGPEAASLYARTTPCEAPHLSGPDPTELQRRVWGSRPAVALSEDAARVALRPLPDVPALDGADMRLALRETVTLGVGWERTQAVAARVSPLPAGAPVAPVHAPPPAEVWPVFGGWGRPFGGFVGVRSGAVGTTFTPVVYERGWATIVPSSTSYPAQSVPLASPVASPVAAPTTSQGYVGGVGASPVAAW